MKTNKPVVGIILDGFGIRNSKVNNPVSVAQMPFYKKMLKDYPNTQIYASEEYVGLPSGQMGNSEVGHLTLGAGRVLYQDLLRINKAIESRELNRNIILKEQIKRVKEKNATIHLIGLVSTGGIHSHINHLFALLDIFAKNDIKNIKVHCILDGRDTPADSGRGFVRDVQTKLNELGVGEIVTLIGRFYAMDRESRWVRTEKAFDLFCYGVADHKVNNFENAFDEFYARNVSDEFAPPYTIGAYSGIKNNDEVLFFNFRPDRMRQITKAFASKKFTEFNRGKMPKITSIAMCQYDKKQENLDSLFKDIIPKNTLSEKFSELGYRQLKLAETTKYAHVTYYFNGTIEKPFKGEDRILIESKNVDNFSQYPPMRAPEITNMLVSEIWKSNYDFILVNFSNCDMVGHTGNFKACVETLEVIDHCLEQVVNVATLNNYTCFILADHGNIEDEGGIFRTTHTINSVPFIITDRNIKMKDGVFALDCFAPSILDYMGLYKPCEMTGESIIKK